MTRPARIWLLSLMGLSGLAIPSLFAALTLTTSTNSVAIPFATTDYNKTTGVAQITKTSAQNTDDPFQFCDVDTFGQGPDGYVFFLRPAPATQTPVNRRAIWRCARRRRPVPGSP